MSPVTLALSVTAGMAVSWKTRLFRVTSPEPVTIILLGLELLSLTSLKNVSPEIRPCESKVMAVQGVPPSKVTPLSNVIS